LTIGSGFTIHGASGIVRDSAVPLINQGTISADVAGGTITIHGSPFTNTGTVEAKNGGLLAMTVPGIIAASSKLRMAHSTLG